MFCGLLGHQSRFLTYYLCLIRLLANCSHGGLLHRAAWPRQMIPASVLEDMGGKAASLLSCEQEQLRSCSSKNTSSFAPKHHLRRTAPIPQGCSSHADSPAGRRASEVLPPRPGSVAVGGTTEPESGARSRDGSSGRAAPPRGTARPPFCYSCGLWPSHDPTLGVFSSCVIGTSYEVLPCPSHPAPPKVPVGMFAMVQARRVAGAAQKNIKM